MQQITENSLNVCANGITSEEISEIRNCIRRIARRRELEGKTFAIKRCLRSSHNQPSFHMYSGVPAPYIYRIGAYCRKHKKKRSTK